VLELILSGSFCPAEVDGTLDGRRLGVALTGFTVAPAAEVDVLRATQTTAEMAAETARAEVAALHASTSWRITAPLRSVARRFRR
jgi:hypothetical protein